MIQVLIALGLSLAQSLGGKTGSLVTQILNTAGTAIAGRDELQPWATAWIIWANRIVTEQRNATPEEDAAANALADAVHANNASLAAGGPGVPLPDAPA